jgi:hypothetical protein
MHQVYHYINDEKRTLSLFTIQSRRTRWSCWPTSCNQQIDHLASLVKRPTRRRSISRLDTSCSWSAESLTMLHRRSGPDEVNRVDSLSSPHFVISLSPPARTSPSEYTRVQSHRNSVTINRFLRRYWRHTSAGHVTSTGQTSVNPRALVTGVNKQGRSYR